jgi:hypothetical protein
MLPQPRHERPSLDSAIGDVDDHPRYGFAGDSLGGLGGVRPIGSLPIP